MGWTIGGGAEMRLGSNWSLKGEYLYYDLGDETVVARRVGFIANDTNFVTSRFESTGHIARGGINYKFGGDCCAAPLK